MRIRTIKPEFWQSETMASIPKDSRLLAIALLNYADDEGFFLSIPQVIQGALFPFDEDSTNVRRGLDDLSRIGFCTLGKTPEGKRIGRITNFLEHQRVDRPQPSKIAGLEVSWQQFDECSTNVRRGLDVGMEGNGKGMEGEEEGKVVETAQKPQQRKRGETQKQATPPTEHEWATYCMETWPDWSRESAVDSYAYYASVGWRTKAGPIKEWRAAARTAYGNAKAWGKLQPKQQTPPPTFEEWIEEANILVRNRPRGSAEWPYAGAEAEFQKNQANGWRFVQDWKSAIASAHSRFLSIEDAAQARRQR